MIAQVIHIDYTTHFFRTSVDYHRAFIEAGEVIFNNYDTKTYNGSAVDDNKFYHKSHIIYDQEKSVQFNDELVLCTNSMKQIRKDTLYLLYTRI